MTSHVCSHSTSNSLIQSGQMLNIKNQAISPALLNKQITSLQKTVKDMSKNRKSTSEAQKIQLSVLQDKLNELTDKKAHLEDQALKKQIKKQLEDKVQSKLQSHVRDEAISELKDEMLTHLMANADSSTAATQQSTADKLEDLDTKIYKIFYQEVYPHMISNISNTSEILKQNMENIRNGNIQTQNTIQFKPFEFDTSNQVTIDTTGLSLNPPTVTPSTDVLSDRPSLLDGSFTKLPVNPSLSSNSNSEEMREILNNLEGQNIPIHSPSTDLDTQELLEIMNSMKAQKPLSALDILTPEQKELLLKDPQRIQRD